MLHPKAPSGEDPAPAKTGHYPADIEPGDTVQPIIPPALPTTPAQVGNFIAEKIYPTDTLEALVGSEIEAALTESPADTSYLETAKNLLAINHPSLHLVWDDAVELARTMARDEQELPGKLREVLLRVGHHFGSEYDRAMQFAKKHG